MALIAVLADIHSNLRALERALSLIESEGVTEVRICGDVVGYGTDANECCARVRGLGCPVVAGNHDWAVAGLTEYRETHSEAAVRGIEETKRTIAPEHLAWLKSLPLTHSEADRLFVHATPLAPERWYYLTLGSQLFEETRAIWQDVRLALSALPGRVCFVGHTHAPALFLEKGVNRVAVIEPSRPLYRLGDHRAIVDVGSVGLPRNRERSASLVLFDTAERTVAFRRFHV
jgi:predicted phosphodiesterase